MQMGLENGRGGGEGEFAFLKSNDLGWCLECLYLYASLILQLYLRLYLELGF